MWPLSFRWNAYCMYIDITILTVLKIVKKTCSNIKKPSIDLKNLRTLRIKKNYAKYTEKRLV